jgi:hypothetical protein
MRTPHVYSRYGCRYTSLFHLSYYVRSWLLRVSQYKELVTPGIVDVGSWLLRVSQYKELVTPGIVNVKSWHLRILDTKSW